jgi:phosphatidylserine/phosphatidylglycerophosphate/cardiolipin synthase-like enzyme
MNFGDLDVVVIGPVVKEVSNQFDLYWNNQSSIPMAALVRQNTTPRQFTEKRAVLTEYHTITERSAYAQTVRDSEFVRQLRSRNVSYFWGRATIVNDHPDKVATSAAKIETHLAPQLRDVVAKTKRELFLVSPYFVPGKQGVDLLAGVHQRGVRVVVITNSLASTDGVMVHSKYKLDRKPLLEAGIENCMRLSRPPAPYTSGERTASADRADRVVRVCMRRHSPSTAGLALSAPTTSIRARATEHRDGCSLQLSGAGEASARNDSTRSGP